MQLRPASLFAMLPCMSPAANQQHATVQAGEARQKPARSENPCFESIGEIIEGPWKALGRPLEAT